jgi:hypothetical protein
LPDRGLVAGTAVAILAFIMNALERRRSVRLPDVLSARWRRGPRVIDVPVLDISAHGFRIATDEWIPINHVMDLELFVGLRPISLLVTSRTVDPTNWARGIGCEILLAAPDDQRRWDAYYQSIVERWRAVDSAEPLRQCA